jgi:hypothetical protein
MENVSHLINQALDKEQKELNLSKQGLTKLPLEINTVAKLRGFNGCRRIVNTTKRGKLGKNLG